MNLKKEILIRARSLLSTNDAWTSGTYARTLNPLTSPGKKYTDTSPLSDDAGCFCSLGAVVRAAADLGFDRDQLEKFAKDPRQANADADVYSALMPLAISFLENMPHSSWTVDRGEYTIVWGCNDALRSRYQGVHGEDDHKILLKVFDEAISSIDRGYEVHVLTKLSEVGWEKRFPTEFAAREELRRYVCGSCKKDENITAQSTMDDLLATFCGLEFSYEVVVEH